MTKSRILAGLAMAAGCLTATAAHAAPGPVSATPRIIHQSKDASGTTTRVYYATPADVTVEIRNARVAIQKRFTPGRSDTTIQSGGEVLKLSLNTSGLSLATPRGVLLVSGSEASARRARAMLEQSAAFRQALATLKGMDVSRQTPVTPLLLTTKAFLQSLVGDVTGYVAVGVWSHRALASGLIVKVRADGPTECWNEYVKEAVAAYDEMTDCVKNAAWWDLVTSSACHLIYDMRAIGAMSWWISCVSLDRNTTEAA